MKFNVKCVREMLLNSGEVFTVRKWKSKNRYGVTQFEGKFYQVEKIRAVSGSKSLRKYVRKSGFDNVNDWWSAIKNFDALRGQLYHVTLMEEDLFPLPTGTKVLSFNEETPILTARLIRSGISLIFCDVVIVLIVV